MSDLCGACKKPVGQWRPTQEGREQGYIDCFDVVCDHCGNWMWKGNPTNPETIDAMNGLFKAVTEGSEE